ncbi:MAG: hypothetical protein M3300_02800 [Actinomycetota bacterium]|nr:hypothetical protein [Actinomycetota bacterium]
MVESYGMTEAASQITASQIIATPLQGGRPSGSVVARSGWNWRWSSRMAEVRPGRRRPGPHPR